MQVLGFLLIGLGIIDFAISWVGIELYSTIGIHLPQSIAQFTPLVAGGIGICLLIVAYNKDVASEFEENLNEDEKLIKKSSISVKHSTFKQEAGLLFLTNQRLKYVGTSTQSSIELGSKDVEIVLKDISSIKGLKASVSLFDKEGNEYKFMVGLGRVNSWVKEISEANEEILVG